MGSHRFEIASHLVRSARVAWRSDGFPSFGTGLPQLNATRSGKSTVLKYHEDGGFWVPTCSTRIISPRRQLAANVRAGSRRADGLASN